MNSKKTILITGASSGFGKAIASEATKRGDKVIGTVRKESDRKTFLANLPHSDCQILDVTQEHNIPSLVEMLISKHKKIDVLINNAGYGHEGICEESPMSELRQQFEVNVFGAVAITKALLPFMRTRRCGHIINITSMGGHITLPGIAYYCGSKFALEGISEALSKELKPLGIKVTAVAPGSFRTDWAGRSMIRSERSIEDYDELFDPIRAKRLENSGKQLGDPALAAKVMLDIIHHPTPPVHLLLGSDALMLVKEKLLLLGEEISRWENVTRSTDSPLQ